jgi:hypothetical protein
MQHLDDLRRSIGDGPVTRTSLEAVLGVDGLKELRRWYFPRWRPNRAHAANESLRAARSIVVESMFEQEVVRALAPADLRLRVKIVPRTAETAEEAASEP